MTDMPQETAIDRRDFIARAMGVATAAAVVPRLRAQNGTRTSPNSTPDYGFIGAGSRGQQLLQHLSRIDKGRCVAMSDIFARTSTKASKPSAATRKATTTTESCWPAR